MNRFKDRRQAGKLLAVKLDHLRAADPLVLALPRGGVPVAFEVAQALGAELDLLFVRKLGAPGYEELGIGAVVDGAAPQAVFNEEVMRQLNPKPDYVQGEMRRQLDEIERRRAFYLGGRARAHPHPRPHRDRCRRRHSDGRHRARGAGRIAPEPARPAGARRAGGPVRHPRPAGKRM